MTNLNKPNTFKIRNHLIGNEYKTFIIAEIGINHEGNLSYCIKMIKAAAQAGANAVKIQTVDVNESYEAASKSYQEFRNKNFSNKEIKQLIKLSKKLNLIFFSTPGDISSLKRLHLLKIPIIKISSGLSNNFPMIREAIKKKIPLIISTGFDNYNDLKELNNYLKKFQFKKIAILKCVSKYPLLDKEVNMKNMMVYKKFFNYPIGYSDHTKSILTPSIAVAHGASIIEKHFTLDKTRKGADHHISLEPNEFFSMVRFIRETENILGSNKVKLPNIVKINKKKSQRAIVTKKNILKGEKFSLNNIKFVRIKKKYSKPPKYFFKIENKKSKKNYKINEII